MKDSTIPMLIIGLVISFGVGFLVGHSSQTVVSPFPVNYSPERAAASEAVKISQENVKTCYDLIAQQLQHPRDCQKEVAH